MWRSQGQGKVTASKHVENPYPCNVELSLAITSFLYTYNCRVWLRHGVFGQGGSNGVTGSDHALLNARIRRWLAWNNRRESLIFTCNRQMAPLAGTLRLASLNRSYCVCVCVCDTDGVSGYCWSIHVAAMFVTWLMWPRVTKCTHSRMVCLRLEGSLVSFYLFLIPFSFRSFFSFFTLLSLPSLPRQIPANRAL